MPFDSGTVARCTGYGDLELARQERKFRMKTGPLADQFGIRAGVRHLIGRSAGKVIRCHIADTIAGGLDGMHFHIRQLGQDVRRFHQFRPVILDVLTGGEMAVALVVPSCDMGQPAQLV